MWLRFFVAVLVIYPFKITMSQNTCEFRETCGECIRDPHQCVWCTTANITKARCTSTDHAATCNDRDIENPLSRVEYDDSLNFSYTLGQYRQLQPTKVDIWLRPGDTQEFTFHFKPAKDYPLDLYFLIDFSKSMDAAVARTAERDISNGLRDLTNNIYLGLGSFIDKKAAPYVLSTDQNTYSFKHHLNLTANAKLFSHAINNARLGSNFDPSEGGLDALAQVLACKEKIGWREDSRKIIIFLTDESYHVAGDGKWAGIFTPYDGKCYMENDEYTKELEMDYPSIGQINKLVDESQITVYFAVLEKVYDEYKMLTNVVTGSLCGRLQNNSQSFVDAIHDMYKSLSQSLSIQLNINDLDHNHIDVEIDPDCLGRSLDNPQCKMASTNRDMKNFTAIVTLKDYYGVNETTFSVTPQGFREKIDVNMHVINECECTDRGERNSIFCNRHGIYECGICRCKPERYGSNCQCKGTGDNNDNSTCIAGNVDLLCSGRGNCKCGKCECYPDYEGQFCEFSKDDCPGKTREGPCSMHGTCQLGNCVCHTGWTGEKCDCPTSTEYCRHFDDKETPGIVSYGEECSGLGDCTCGECKCRKTAVWDSRRQNRDYCYFEPCAECHEQQCQAVAACALCQHKNLDSNVESCARSCDSEFVVHKTNGTQTNYTEPWKICRLTTDIGCFTTFAYKYAGPNKLELHVSTQNDCMESYYRFGGSALGVVLLIGLLTLITWKALTTLRDRREYEAFKNQHDTAEWEHGANPIYESPNTTFYNPAFGQN